MKRFLKKSWLVGQCLLLLFMVNCQRDVTDFGFDGSISGLLKDQNGNLVSGDITSSTFVVNALGQGDVSRIEMRVNGDGSFQNTKLFPKSYKIWVSGPLTMQDDTLRVDLSSNRTVMKDIVVVPYLDLKKPALVGTPTASSLTIAYEISGNQGKTPAVRELYVSTNPYATSSTGTGATYTTKKITLPDNKGSVTVPGLNSKTKYYVRLGALATGIKVYNFSDQFIVETL